jgi:hypothetical protein
MDKKIVVRLHSSLEEMVQKDHFAGISKMVDLGSRGHAADR